MNFGDFGSEFPSLEFKTALEIRDLEMNLRLGEFLEFPFPIRLEDTFLNSDILYRRVLVSRARRATRAIPSTYSPIPCPNRHCNFLKKSTFSAAHGGGCGRFAPLIDDSRGTSLYSAADVGSPTLLSGNADNAPYMETLVGRRSFRTRDKKFRSACDMNPISKNEKAKRLYCIMRNKRFVDIETLTFLCGGYRALPDSRTS